jgi:putative endonuclease
MTNHSKSLYIGMTNDLRKRVAQHQEMRVDGFTKRYRITCLIYYEEYDDVRYAIERETRLKTWSRQKKLDLIASLNPEWKEIEP